MPQARGIGSVHAVKDVGNGHFEVSYSNNRTQRVTTAQLRDLGMGAKDWNPYTNQRRADAVTNPDSYASLTAKKIDLEEEKLVIQWSDGEQSDHDAVRLARLLSGMSGLPAKQPWLGPDLDKDDLVVDFQSLSTPAGVQRLASTFFQRGIVVARGVPTDRAGCEAVASIIGSKFQVGMFGVDWDVKVVAGDGNDTAYSGDELPLHTDGCYLKSQPEVQALLCIRPDQHGGGFSGFADGFRVAERLRERHPRLFEVLCNREVTFQFEDDKIINLAQHTVLHTKDDGQLLRVTWNNLDRAILPDDVEHAKALRAWDECLKEEDVLLSFRLDAGEMVIFDNQRCMHSRSGQLRADSVRLLIGNYYTSECLIGQMLRPRPLSI